MFFTFGQGQDDLTNGFILFLDRKLTAKKLSMQLLKENSDKQVMKLYCFKYVFLNDAKLK